MIKAPTLSYETNEPYLYYPRNVQWTVQCRKPAAQFRFRQISTSISLYQYAADVM
jgi:hypothetical protein